MLYACVTSPFVDEDLYNKSIETYYLQLKEGFDSLITVLPFQHFLLDENGPMNFKIGREHCNSQYLPKYHFFTNGVVLAPKENVAKWHYNFGPNAYRLEVGQ